MPDLVGEALAFRQAVSLIPVVAITNRPVIISGETGTGKELIARAIHAQSDRAGSRFVAVNCGSLVDTLVDDALFGHEPGAFTDARLRHRGLLHEAQGGTLFLDEIEALSTKGQVTLLRVLEDGTFRALGSSRIERADIRVLVATNASLESMVQAGSFRADLYYRLCVFRIDLPPLRERRLDIFLLAEHFLKKHAAAGSPPMVLDHAARHAIEVHSWPGNVRELENAIVRATHLRRAGAITIDDLGLPAVSSPPSAPRTYQALKQSVVAAFEADYLRKLIADHHGNITRAARAAGKERRELARLLKKHRIDPQEFRRS